MPTDLERLLRIIHRVCANRDWRLLGDPDLGISPESFARRVGDRLRHWLDAGEHAEITDGLIERAVINEYCRLLHHAIGLERTAAQQRGLDEVWNYVTPIIRRVLPDMTEAAACANTVLLVVWRQRGDVRDPGSFLKWTAMIAARAAFQALRARTGREILFADLFGAEASGDDDERVEATASTNAARQSRPSSALAAVEDAESAEWLAALIRRCLGRMRAGAEAIIRLALAGEPVSEVSRALGVSPANLYVIKTRALARLRRCKPLLAALGQALPPVAGGVQGGKS